MEPLTRAPHLIAEIQFGVLARSLGIALVVVAPFGYALWRRTRRAPGEGGTVPAPVTTQDRPSLEAVIAQITAYGELGSGSSGDADSVTITVPADVTIGGSVAPAEVVDSIVRDALARSGLVPTAEIDTGTARVIECQRRQPSRPAG